MSLFGKRKKQLPATAHEEVLVLNTGDLEHMVAEVYKDKLALEDELARAKNEAKQHSEMMTRCQAAEVLARNLRNEKDAAVQQKEFAEKNLDHWRAKCQKAEDRATVLSLKIDDLERDARGRKMEIEQEVTGDVVIRMLDALIFENGNWSKARVEEFVRRFLPENMKREEEK